MTEQQRAELDEVSRQLDLLSRRISAIIGDESIRKKLVADRQMQKQYLKENQDGKQTP